MTVPTSLFNFPSSFSVSTVMPTLVAVRMTPTKNASIHCPGRKINPTPNPSASGSKTPPMAMRNAFSPVRRISFRSVSSPAENMTSTTPISAKVPSGLSAVFCMGKSHPSKVSFPKIAPQMDGPISTPARINPST